MPEQTLSKQKVLTMSQKERERLSVLSRLIKREVTCIEAAESLGITKRQIYRIRDRYVRDGDEGLVHRLRGSTSNFGCGYALRKRLLDLYRERYSDYGPKLFAEMILDHHASSFKRIPDHETIRRWLLKAGLWSTERKRRAHRRKRERRDSLGSMIQFDGSDHDWFEERAAKCTLLVAVDDASGTVLMRFARSENTRDVLVTLRAYIEQYGIPREIYTDRASVYHTKDGKRLTDVGRALTRLGVTMIKAHSPQGKGRVERANRTQQDRLVKALRREGISTIEEANRYLVQTYLAEHNTRFAITSGLRDIHRPSVGLNLDNILCYELTRRVYNDYTITLDGGYVQLERSENPLPPVGRSVIVRRWLKDNSLHIFWNELELKYSVVKARPKPRQHGGLPQAANHPWRRYRSDRNARDKNRKGLNKKLNTSKKKIVSYDPSKT